MLRSAIFMTAQAIVSHSHKEKRSVEVQQRRCAILTFDKVATLRPARADVSGTFGLPAIAVALACAALLGCAGKRPQSNTTPGLETGITSNNGGGERALRNQPNIGITTRVGPVR